MLRSSIFLTGFALVTALGAAVGCGDDGTGGTGGGTPSGGIRPPTRTEDAPAGDGSGKKTFGITKISIGATPATAWEEIGYDLDGIVTTDTFDNHCKPRPGGSPANVFKDGKDGRDNAFGKKLVPLIVNLASGTDLEASINESLQSSFTIIVDMPGLGPDASYKTVDSRLYIGKNGNAGAWELVPEFLNGGSQEDPKVKFPNAYLTDNTWVNGDPGNLELAISIGGVSVNLTIGAAIISMNLDGAHGKATGGIIAGVIPTDSFINQLRELLPRVQESFCDGGDAVEGILQSIAANSDIMADGSQDPSKTCDGISIGLGFEAAPVTIAKVGDPAEPPTDPCTEGGAGGTGGAGVGGAGGN